MDKASTEQVDTKFGDRKKRKRQKRKKSVGIVAGHSSTASADPSSAALAHSVDAHAILATPADDSREAGRAVLEWLVAPISATQFYEENWERAPLLVQRSDAPDYYDGWLDVAQLWNMIEEHPLNYGEHIDCTSYTDGKRKTLTPANTDLGDRAVAAQVQQLYQDGCSVRLRKPHTHSEQLWKLLQALEEEWGSYCGVNAYLTPAGTQGFAPHYDDIDAFVMQVHGSKRWRVYKPPAEKDMLARFSSEDLTPKQLAKLGEPLIEVTLNAGDLLYMPRGFVHQADTQSGDSLHLTVSTNQQHNWGALLEQAVVRAVQIAVEENVALRAAPPVGYMQYMGVQYSDAKADSKAAKLREAFTAQAAALAAKAIEQLPAVLDGAVDQMAAAFQHAKLPPPTRTPASAECTIDSQLKLVSATIARAVVENDQVVLYHCAQNAREYHGKPPQGIVFDLDQAEAIDFVLQSYPESFDVADMPMKEDQDKIDIAENLLEQGVVWLVE